MAEDKKKGIDLVFVEELKKWVLKILLKSALVVFFSLGVGGCVISGHFEALEHFC